MDGRYKTWESKTLCRTENIKKSDREQKFQSDFSDIQALLNLPTVD